MKYLTIHRTLSPETFSGGESKPGFQIQIGDLLSAGLSSGLDKRVAVQFISGNAQVSSSCSPAITYSLVNGQLLQTSGGTTRPFSVNNPAGSIPFTPLASVGQYTGEFSLSDEGALIWSNDAFPTGGAQFCSMGGTIYAVFDATLPSGCNQITLSAITCK